MATKKKQKHGNPEYINFNYMFYSKNKKYFKFINRSKL